MRGAIVIFLFLLMSFVVSAQLCDNPIFEGNEQCISVEGNPKCLDAACSCNSLNEIEPQLNPNGNELTASMCCPLGNQVLLACTQNEIVSLMHEERGYIQSTTSEQCGTLNGNNLYLVSVCSSPELDCHITNNVADCCTVDETWNEEFETCEPTPFVEPILPELPGTNPIIPELVSIPTDFVIELTEDSTILIWSHPFCEEEIAAGATGFVTITGGSVIDNIGSFFSNIFNKIISAFSKNIKAERVILPTQYFIIEKEFNGDTTYTNYITECTYTDKTVQGGSRYRVEAIDNDVVSGFTDWRIGFAAQCFEEGEQNTCDTRLLGICSKGVQICSDNIWGECVQVNEPTDEMCANGADDDCDGYLDCDDVSCTTADECGGLINIIVPPEEGSSGGSSGGGSSGPKDVPVDAEIPRRRPSQLPVEESTENVQELVQNIPTTSKSSNLITILLIVLGVLIVAAGTLLIVLRKKIFHHKPKESYSLGSMNENRLKDYVNQARSQGVTPKEIKNGLLKAGWREEDINKFLR